MMPVGDCLLRCHSVTAARDAGWQDIWNVWRLFSVSFGTASVDINALVRHRSNSLDLPIIYLVLLQSY